MGIMIAPLGAPVKLRGPVIQWPMSERTLVMLKPGTLQRRIAGEVLSRFERRGLKLIALKMLQIDEALAEKHYAEHRGKDFYGPLVEYITSSPVLAMILEGPGAIGMVRRLVGATNVNESLPGSIRGDYGASTRLNIVHASDSSESAQREISLYFTEKEIFSWEDPNAPWY